MIADGLSQVRLNNADCSPDWLVHKLTKEIKLYHDDNK